MLVVENNSVYESVSKEEVCQRNVRYTRRLSESGKWQRTKRKRKNQSKRQKTTQTVKSGWFTGQGNFRSPIDVCLRLAEAVSVTTSATAEKK